MFSGSQCSRYSPKQYGFGVNSLYCVLFESKHIQNRIIEGVLRLGSASAGIQIFFEYFQEKLCSALWNGLMNVPLIRQYYSIN